MTTKVNDNQIKDEYYAKSLPYVKSLIAGSNVTIVKDSIGNYTVGIIAVDNR